jgi:pimeloyl-ACP methyl ester carboxylesterase
MPFFEHDGLNFHYREQGTGIPFIFQHGLGGDVDQPFSLFSPPQGFRLLAFDCRAHGQTHPVGDPDKISFATFADDLTAFMDALGIGRAVVGGISMGAGVTLNFTLRCPERVAGLVMVRPAWLDRSMTDNLQVIDYIGSQIRRYGAKQGLELFKKSGLYESFLRESPDVANSLVGQFEHPRAEETVVKLERMPRDAPNYDSREWERIRVPTLILAHHKDYIHPFEYGERLHEGIPGSEFGEVTPKSVSLERYTQDVQNTIGDFLRRHTW